MFLTPLFRVKYTGLFAIGCIGLIALADIWQIVGDLAVDKVSGQADHLMLGVVIMLCLFLLVA